MTAVRPLTLRESADLLGRYRYVELALFGALGARAALGARGARAGVPAAAGYLAGASLAHGWRARLIEERLPVSVGLPDARACTLAPSPELDEALALLVVGSDVDVLDGLLGALYPAMAAAYAERLAAASLFADPPVTRLLGRLLADLDVLRRDGAEVAAGLGLPGGGACQAIEALLGRGGGVFGPLRPEARDGLSRHPIRRRDSTS